MIISKDFKFEAAHHLRNYVGKCANQHGHSYFGTVWIQGEVDNNGFVLDYNFISEAIDKLDHKDLNELDEFKEKNPTAENIADYIVGLVDEFLPINHQIAVKLHETATSSVFISTDDSLNFLAA